MRIRNLKNSQKVPFNLDAYILHTEEKIEVVHLTLKPGEKLEEHTNPFDVIFFIIHGKGNLSINGTTKELCKGDTIKVTSEKKRGWVNNGNMDLNILVIKLL